MASRLFTRSRLRDCAAAVAAIAVSAGVVAPASAAALPDGPPSSPFLWATVNLCDTPAYPAAMGIRGSMPGTGDRRDTLFMRFQVQFRRASDGAWVGLGRAGDSGFLELGHGAARARQAGRTFTLMRPGAGRPAYQLRGLVLFEWRRDGGVFRRARRLTSPDHPGTAGADPGDFTSATCTIR